MPKIDKEYLKGILIYLYYQPYVSHYKERQLWNDFFAREGAEDMTWDEVKTAYKYLCSEEEVNPLYIGRPRKLSILYEFLCVLRIYKFRNYFPVSAKYKPIEVTNRYDYETDKYLFRTFKRLIREHSLLDRTSYVEYVYLAKKYDWEYLTADEDAEY
jgi:hypothetical protein